ncbi:MAG: Crp/Fnr family transcriptional regulator [Burkholderiaceae bacterium]|nr:Crp/Fnr family transcriptional regulator [Burkholderiaceae bacterium]
MTDHYAALAKRLLEQDEAMQLASAATCYALLESGSIRRHASHALLCGREVPATELVLLLEGSLEVSTEGSDGRRSILWYIPAGQWVNLISLIDGRGSVHDIRTHTEAVALHVPRTAFLQALRADAGFSMAMLKILCQRSRMFYENMAMDALLPLRSRVARMLTLLMGQYGRPKEGGVEIDLKISQDELAAMLAVSRHSLNRELKALQEQGLISIAYSHITVRDVESLHAQIVPAAGG